MSLCTGGATGVSATSQSARLSATQPESARQTLVAELPRRRRPSAILAGSDYIALGLIRGPRDLGIGVPDEISIMGCESIIFAEYMEPPVTTLSFPKKEKGTMATEMLITMIEDSEFAPEPRTLLETSIVERESVKTIYHRE